MNTKEKLQNFQKETEKKFIKSDEYKYIKQFAKKYGNNADEADLFNLQSLLSNRKYNFSVNKLKDFIRNELWMPVEKIVFERVFLKKPATVDDAVRAFTEHCNYNSADWLVVFMGLLIKEDYKEVSIIENKNTLLELLTAKIKKAEKRIELDNFEKRLLEEDEQIELENIDSLSGYEFEDFLKTLFSKMGYQVERTKLSGDQGADLVVIKFGEKSVIQAKRFGGKVGNKAVQEILAAMSLYRAEKGMVITNRYFTPAAVELADANRIELIDRNSLEELINRYW